MTNTMTIEYCSLISKKLAEPLSGTASQAQHLIFITWPKRFWKYEALVSGGGFPQGLKRWIKSQSVEHGKIVLRLISQPGMTAECCSLHVYPDGLVYEDIAPDQLKTVLEDHFAGKGQQHSPRVQEIPEVMVCTHGRHDKCCAKFGQALYAQFQRGIENRGLSLNLWQSSHLGGHRFAPTLVHLPSGEAHGHVTSEQVPALLDAWTQQRVHPKTYRGNVFRMDAEQLAEAWLHHAVSNSGTILESRLESLEENGSQRQFTVAYRTAEQPEMFQHLELVLHHKTVAGPGGCDALDEPEERSGWVLTKSRQLNAPLRA
tara:strand:- start:176 stop:1123 length:948 start_codon:yes stop_codon:yes gene_type:complete